ncbi:MAG: hypothetical protein LBD32_00145, partial [Cytophagales bacterium]|nr:hypothetical protein [Cytophagales bacterium]
MKYNKNTYLQILKPFELLSACFAVCACGNNSDFSSQHDDEKVNDYLGLDPRVREIIRQCFGTDTLDLAQLQELVVQLAMLGGIAIPWGPTMTEPRGLLLFINQNIERFVVVFDRVILREPMANFETVDDSQGLDPRVMERIGQCFGTNTLDLAQLQDLVLQLAVLTNIAIPWGPTMTEGQRLLRFINQNIERFVEVFDRVIPREPM